MTIRNLLPPNPDPMPEDHNRPHHFNTTNIHTHGLHVDPGGIADNVLRKMPPGEDYQVRVEIPEDHAPGTFWYHPHVHGSTAIQVSSGMGGALIIEGGLDDVPAIEKAEEQIFMFQQVPYDGHGKIEHFGRLMGTRNWLERLKRHTTINGQLVPVITMRPGEVRRWRFVHAGVKVPLHLQLEGHKLHEIATDGIALGKCDSWETLVLESGYRSDAMVKANLLGAGQHSAEYWLRDVASIERGNMQSGEDAREYLAKVIVSGEPVDMELPCDEDELSGLIPFDPITDDEIEGTQEVVFSISRTDDDKLEFTIDGKPFGEGEVRTLKLGSADEWTVSTDPESVGGRHPFHIHVNPFQVSRLDPDGNPELIWKDTLVVVRGEPQTLRMRYVRYSGRFVIHCHFLDHEDRGMMQLVEILE
jgi:FtsP/CotA-like multicopper oxidase with cupredoxin domain